MISKWVFVLIFEFGEIGVSFETDTNIVLKKVREGRGDGPL